METGRRIRLLRRLGLVLVVWTFVLMGAGAWVKATGSGLSCPDWPQCYGQWLPPFPSIENGGVDENGDEVAYTQAQILYEWAHRLIAATLGVPFLLFVWMAWRDRDLNRNLRFIPVGALVVLLVQAGLGGATVLKQNPAYLTTLHLLTATLFFALVLVATCFSFLRPRPAQVAAPKQRVAFAYPGEVPVRNPGDE